MMGFYVLGDVKQSDPVNRKHLGNISTLLVILKYYIVVIGIKPSGSPCKTTKWL